MKLNEFITYAQPLFEARRAIELVSGPGLGKSSAIVAAVARLSKIYKEPVAISTVILSGMDAADARGFCFPVKMADGRLLSQFSRSPILPAKHSIEIFENGERVTDQARLDEIGVPSKGVLFLDEFGQADIDVQKPMGQLALDMRVGEHFLPPEWTIWMASNRVRDRSGVARRLAFLDNRICSIEVDPDYEGWQRWALRAGVNGLVISFANRNQGLVFKDAVPEKGGKFCTPRSLVLAAEMLDRLRPDDMPINQLPLDGFAYEIVKGWLGEGDAAVFMEHCKLGATLPDPEEVFRNPATAPVPERPDAQFVMASNLSIVLARGGLNQKRCDAAFVYVERLPTEMQVAFVTGVMSTAPQVMATKAFGQWSQRNQELIVTMHSI